MAKVGHPPKYEKPEDIDKAINEYFDDIKEREDIPLIADLAYRLGFASTQSLFDQCARKDYPEQFSAIIKRAKEKCGIILNKAALRGEVKERTACLNLSSNHGLIERKEISKPDEIKLTDEELEERIKLLSKG